MILLYYNSENALDLEYDYMYVFISEYCIILIQSKTRTDPQGLMHSSSEEELQDMKKFISDSLP